AIRNDTVEHVADDQQLLRVDARGDVERFHALQLLGQYRARLVAGDRTELEDAITHTADGTFLGAQQNVRDIDSREENKHARDPLWFEPAQQNREDAPDAHPRNANRMVAALIVQRIENPLVVAEAGANHFGAAVNEGPKLLATKGPAVGQLLRREYG